MPSENALFKILGKKPLLQKVEDFYLFKPLMFDLITGLSFGALYLALDFLLPPLFGFDFDGLKDILNELVSSSFASGGIILGALAIIAAIKMTVPTKDEKDAETGKELLYNHVAFNEIIGVFVKSCVSYVAVFLVVTYTRGLAVIEGYDWVLAIMVFSLFVMCSAFLRCVWILRKVLKVQ